MMTKLGFIGSGKMAYALIQSMKSLSDNIISSDRSNERLEYVKDNAGIQITTDNIEVVKNSDVIFICVKPQDVKVVLEEIKEDIGNKLIISIAGGIKLDFIESILVGKKVIRVMPNTPCLVGEMAAGYAVGKNVTEEDIELADKLLNSAGKAFLLEEKDLDAVTALSGSGPAFFAQYIVSMVDAAVEEGLDRKTAIKLACKTALGTGKLLLETNTSPEELIKMVSSPGGTTVAGLKVYKEENANEILKKVIKAAATRSRELGK
ncbi:pyrroline-5-carboxylate reductase [Candidatus Woesearchaeota archaeon]|nr:pyrroline-5-carboxylate reductase [Candidatus Woesearchaeota archaeon]